MDVTCTVNLNGLEEKLYQIGPKLAKAAVRKALKAGAQILVDEAKARAPVDTGALRDSISMVIRLSGKEESGYAAVGPAYDVAAKNGSQDPGVYGKWVELGLDSRNYPMQPYLRPALDGKAQEVIDKFVEVLKEGLDEVVKP